MMTVTEKAAYIKGLVDMAHFEAETDEVKLIKAMAEVIEEMALSIADLEDEVAMLEELVDEIDEDLGDVEEFLLDEDDCDCGCDCDCDDDCDCDCGCCGDSYIELECPACNEIICLDDSLLDEDTIQCPACGETLEFDFDEDEDYED